MRIFHIQGDQFTELQTLPEAPPSAGYFWVGVRREDFETHIDTLQAALQRWAGGQLVDLHVSDLLNHQLPSHFDYTSLYDLLVFRRLAPGSAAAAQATDPDPDPQGASPGASATLTRIDTHPVGFVVFDRVLLTVHEADCQVRDFFASRLQQQGPNVETRNGTRLPPNPSDMALRMVNYMVDSYLELRRLLTRQFDQLQQQLFGANAGRVSWTLLLEARNGLHLLEDTCEDQRAAITEWIDALEELPREDDLAVLRERELLGVRARDVLEHIERVLTHVRRLESSAETAVQMHFSAQSNRTNEIMRTLTVLTAIFMPLNLVTGFFGMNFEGLPLIHSARGFWWTFGFMAVVGAGLAWFFWRKRYLGRAR
jgi:magnesium transporter